MCHKALTFSLSAKLYHDEALVHIKTLQPSTQSIHNLNQLVNIHDISLSLEALVSVRKFCANFAFF
jgi:hypothetical protein